ncbi:MAG: hypothetical protein CMQ12_01230 [Gammaproteobacteria bacterium]|nr:hypothetical protein [Gammaproteobacteria bacterium]
MLFLDSRNKRLREVKDFFVGLIDNGLMVHPKPPITLESLLLSSWLVTDQWLPHLDMYDISATDEKAISEGAVLIQNIFRPFFTEKALTELEKMDAAVSN